MAAFTLKLYGKEIAVYVREPQLAGQHDPSRTIYDQAKELEVAAKEYGAKVLAVKKPPKTIQ